MDISATINHAYEVSSELLVLWLSCASCWRVLKCTYSSLCFLPTKPSNRRVTTRALVCNVLISCVIRFIEDRYNRQNIMLLWILHAFVLSTHPSDTKQPAGSPVAHFDHSSKCCCHREQVALVRALAAIPCWRHLGSQVISTGSKTNGVSEAYAEIRCAIDVQTAWDRESGAAGYASVLIIILYLSVLYLTQYGGTLVSQFEAFFSLSGM